MEENPKYNLELLISCLCCVSKFQYIYNAMKLCNDDELRILREQLRKHSNNGRLNQFLEMEFSNRIGK